MKRRSFLQALAAALALQGAVARSAHAVAPVLFGPLSEAGLVTTPVTFTWSQSIAAGATFNPLTDWQYETPDFDGMIEVFSRATATGLVETISSAGDTLKQEAPVQAGGTAGSIPSRLNTEPVVGRCGRNQKIRVGYRNPTGGAITVDGQIILTPTGGGARRAAPRRFIRRRR
jgi:hypothetical protein